MQNLYDALKILDTHHLTLIGNRWDVDVDDRDASTAAQQLTEVMLDPDRATKEWERLQDDERGALQMLMTVPGSKMPNTQFSRLYGEIRQMGPDKRKREKPHLKPQGLAEVLYYRGFVHLAFAESKTGVQTFVYVPSDLAQAFPTRQVGYDLSKDAPVDIPDLPMLDDEEPMMGDVVLEEEPEHTQRPDTSIVDDLTTLLAYVQTHHIILEDGFLPANARATLHQQFIGVQDERRLDLIIYLAVELALLHNQDGHLVNIRANVKTWLEASRTTQMQQLIEAWHRTSHYNELWNVPTLIPEYGKWQNDPRLIRETLRELIQYMATDGWVSLDGIILELKESEPDFQRPGGDYDSWYIRDAATNNYLNGFESWDAVEGAVLRFTVLLPMFWLALVDLGNTEAEEFATANAFRLTAFGRAWVGRTNWPERADTPEPVTINPQGQIVFPRANSRYDRFQLSRFATWHSAAGNDFIYVISTASLQIAREQGIEAQHIQAFLQRTTGQAVPDELEKRLSMWQTGSASSIVLESMLVLQVDLPETMNTLWETPELRRFLGRRLGPQAVAVRADQAQALVEELKKRGFSTEWLS